MGGGVERPSPLPTLLRIYIYIDILVCYNTYFGYRDYKGRFDLRKITIPNLRVSVFEVHVRQKLISLTALYKISYPVFDFHCQSNKLHSNKIQLPIKNDLRV